MVLRKIVAIIRNEALEKVEGRLVDLRVSGISVTKVKGYGEFANFFNPNWMVPIRGSKYIQKSNGSTK